MGRDVVGKTLHRSLFLSSTSGAPQKNNLVLVTGLVFLFFPLPHPPITLRLLRLAFLGRDVVGKTLHRSLFLSSTSGAPQKNNLVLVTGLVFLFFPLPHPPITLRLLRLAFLGRDVVGKTLHRSLFLSSTSGAPQKNNLVLVTGLVFLFFPLPHPPITLRLLRLAFLGRDVVGKTLHRSLFLSSTSGAPQKNNLVLVTGLVFLFFPLPHPPITLRLLRLAFLGRDVVGKTLHRSLFLSSTSGAPQKNNLVLVTGLVFLFFPLPHPPITLRLLRLAFLGRDVVGKTLHRSLFLSSTSGAPQKNNLVLVTGLVFLFFPLPHPPITLRLLRLAFLGRDVVGKTLHRSLFLSSTSGAPQKNNLVLVTGLVFLFFPLPHPPITLRLLRLAFLGRDVVGKTLHRSLFLSSTSGAPQKNNLVLVTGLVFLFFPLPHPPITLRLLRLAFLGRDVVGKTLHRSLFLSSTSGAPQKNNLVLVTGLVFLFFPLPHPPITLRLLRLAFLGRDVVGKTLHRSLFLSSTSGAPQKNNLVLVTGLVFLFFPLPHPPITLRLLRLAFLGRDVVGKTLHRSLFLFSTSGAPQKPT
ncbi:hypothetical protein [Anaeromassilibacillus sp. Marseille-P3371]|uniref:hypothetical protein n=1 Tax=Anaeromassilibacillus sp. Marseille-P3371 TaxID=1944639 RepID=UPI000A1C8930|nr:hypothetical protein [Anaeromassilibacillus sp. Marseille-P3371]